MLLCDKMYSTVRAAAASSACGVSETVSRLCLFLIISKCDQGQFTLALLMTSSVDVDGRT